VVEERLPAWAGRLIDELHAADRRANDLARTLSAGQINWSPAPGVWSIAQCLEHLRAANDVYLPPMAKALDGRSPSPVDAITPGWFGRWFIRNFIEPSPQTRKARAPRKATPGDQVAPGILDRFLRSNDRVRDLVRRASACDVNRIRFVNPFVPLIRFTVGTGLEITSRHERRHLLQAEGVRKSPQFPLR
jgi:HEAT repeat protein